MRIAFVLSASNPRRHDPGMKLNRRRSAGFPRRGRSLFMTTTTTTATTVHFEPSGSEVTASPGESLFDVAERVGELAEKPERYCRDGGCYRCEMEVNGDLLRICQYKIPETRTYLDVLRIDTDDVWGENVI
uniref:2Fe-2S ferredoxin-type domain-containing protein n=1 Tax=Rhodosorus marinus TaxID=101924 RepID=A0A7S3EMB8_9RHOD|mmetsp:Transcript_43918/g.171627  ORF Transcript_43918/g.171627 Transcript_43918/m.171627 type:complete len:131 (+) Transcript_43918:155-547(+)|eukprot:CAMPEP_0113965226 /NCGR_PEP_ID=MMETSP0011_2-20120614/7623_1 /TAXON_ID=101924 /ORGANISM="Rhodosorus marinus" /LENGTH=130 /DNA_ID=CAMNT_0000977707 /DNA_START=38 /DNA_END=430 /DNA_ORIENTATION=+ /assembly_acc=CAM_ASM_000156